MTNETIRVVAIAITSCPECGTSCDFDEWREMELVSEHTKKVEHHGELTGSVAVMQFETRRCHCGHEYSTRVDGLDEMDLLMPAERYAENFGSARVLARGVEIGPTWWVRWRATFGIGGAAFMALLLLALAVLALARLIL